MGETIMTSKSRILFLAATSLAAVALGSISAKAQSLNLYCSVQIEWCQAIANNFQKETNIKVNMTQKGSGEMLAQIRAEAQNARGDVWFGGTGDPHLAAAEEGLTIENESKNIADLTVWGQGQWAASKKRTVGVYAGAVGFGINTELMASKKIKAPASWADLLKPEYKGEIQVANPNSSGTAYVIIATLVQIMGEDKSFDYMKLLHPNINAYARSGTGPMKAVARGETGISLSFVHDAVTEKNAGFPVVYATPTEGTGYEIGSMSIINGTRNLAQAKTFYDWALTADAQKLGFDVGKQLQTPSNKKAPIPPGAPDLNTIKLISYDFAKFGQAAERKRLIARWDKEVGSLPR
jgi:iron(III) transport system substrate-binding protein